MLILSIKVLIILEPLDIFFMAWKIEIVKLFVVDKVFNKLAMPIHVWYHQVIYNTTNRQCQILKYLAHDKKF